MVEQSGDFNRTILDFLAEVSAATPVRAAAQDAAG
jgi:hypothetical protein